MLRLRRFLDRAGWRMAGLVAIIVLVPSLAVPALGARSRGAHHRHARHQRSANHIAHPNSLLGIRYLPHGPKSQLTPGRGWTLRTKHSRNAGHHRRVTHLPKALHRIVGISRARHTASPTISTACAVPNAPGSPTATSGANQASLSWTAANGNGNAVTGYVLTAVSGSTPKNSEATPASATSAILPGLASGSYTFNIVAVNTCGNSAPATTSAATVTGTASTYASTVIGLNPAAYFRLGEASGSAMLADSSGHGMLAAFDTASNGSALGAGAAIPNDTDTAANSNGNWLGWVGSAPSMPTANQSRTVQAWVKPSDGNCRYVLGTGIISNNMAFSLGECPNSVLISTWQDDLSFTTPEPITDGAWHMITVTYNGTSATAYLDNRLLGTKTFSVPLSTGTGGLALGAYTSLCCANFGYGGVDELAVYPTALTPAQVTSVFNASGLGIPAAPTGQSASSTTNNTATVTWTAASAPTGTSVTGYLVTAKKGGTTFQESIAAPGSATSATLTGLPAANYTFTVTALDPYGSGPAATTSSIAVAGAATTYESTLLADKPAVFYRLAEPTGTAFAADSGGKNVTSTYGAQGGGCNLTLGVAGPLANDAATGAYDGACTPIASEAYKAGLPSGNATRTLQAWVKPGDGYCRFFMGYGANWYSNGEFEVGTCGNSVITRLLNYDNSFYSARSLADGNWHLVTVTSAYTATGGNTITAYLDGQKLGSQVSATPNTAGGTGLEIGGGPTDCCYYGSVADAAVFPAALSSTQLAALMTASGNAIPTTPTGVTATSGVNSATVNWTASTAPGTTVGYYVVTEYLSGKAQQSIAVPGTATTATIDSLPNNGATGFTFKVVAYDTYGSSPASTASPVTTVSGATSTYASTVLTSKPVLYYRLGENGSSVAADSSGNGLLGGYATCGGCLIQNVSGAINDGSDKAATQNGASFLMEAGGSATIPSGDQDRTLEAWIKPNDGSCSRNVVSFGYTQTDQSFSLGECPNQIYVDAWADTHWFYTPRSVADGAWHFLAATYTDLNGVDQLTVYLDGKSLGTQAFAGPLSTPAGSTLWVGGGPNDCCAPFYGSIDEVAVFPTALAATAIASQFTQSQHAAPGAPTGVSATPGTNQAAVSWTAPATGDAPSGFVVTAYAGTAVKGAVAAPATATSAVVTGLPGGTAYTFKVVAYNPYGPGPAGTSSAATPTGGASTYPSAVLADSPVAYYRLTEPTGSALAADSSGQGLGSYNQSVTTYGNAASMPGDAGTTVSSNNNDAIAYNATESTDALLPAANQARTIVAWIKPGDQYCRYAAGYGTNGTDQGFGLYVCPGSNQLGVIGSNDDHYFTTPTTLNDGNWHQVAVAYDGTNITAYVDGVSLGTQQFNAPLQTPFASTLYLGAGFSDNSNRWYGGLSQVAVFPAALTAAQMSGLFAASGYAVPTVPTGVSASSPGNNRATVTWTASSAPGTTVNGYVVTALDGTTPANSVATSGSQTSATINGLKGGHAYTFQVTALDPYGSSAASSPSGSVTPAGSATTFASTVLGLGPSAYYRLGEASGSLAADSSQNQTVGSYNLSTTALGNAGALSSDPNSTSINNVNANGFDVRATNFTSNVLPTGNSPRSAEAWIKPNGAGCWRMVMGYGGQNTAQGFGFWECPNAIYFHGWGDDLQFNTAVNLADGNWHEIVVTYDGTTSVTVYVDGVSIGTQTLSQQLNTPNSTTLWIGASIGNYGSFYGNLQDAAIFPTALSAAQVSSLYAAR